ncbi:phosphoribosylamine--glycine ligase [Tunicatimonas pelagia]|uniref:phosphoribosylamine--glycine ligase n=1 Tax=Tunicatimonas pelagia TaxID=931531 RepID=UPI0026651DD1|nr:phosphoribosylamine--glycine ligase [Tunicatimonas pelagia]WKN43879.1 phosphoribosylamine--glycine ligase [Tunicatimonas pelagia]
MNILLLGSGGREHALAWKISQSSDCTKLFVSPGNAGTSLFNVTENLVQNSYDQSDFQRIANFIQQQNIELIVVGPEAPLVAGITDFLKNNSSTSDVLVVGPTQAGAELEGSKDFAKQFMQKHNIPTAASHTFTAETLEEGLKYVKEQTLPIVLKADGLAAGKGVIICTSYDEATETLRDMLQHQKFGTASQKVVIEEFLDGIELSVFVLTDGKNYHLLPEAKDYKRIGENDTGPNTGGMGAVSPVPFADEAFMSKVKAQIVEPTIQGLAKENIDYRGFIFLGLMNVGGNPYVIEYNVRLGDPETQAIIPRLESDLVELLVATARQQLSEVQVNISLQAAATVVMVSGGYPESYVKGKVISGLSDKAESLVFHAGTEAKEGKTITSGGRVLAVTSLHSQLTSALEQTYAQVDQLFWKDIYYRKDIGQDILGYLANGK